MSVYPGILAATLPLVIAMVKRPALYNGIRHFIFVIPPMTVLAGFAFAGQVACTADEVAATVAVSRAGCHATAVRSSGRFFARGPRLDRRWRGDGGGSPDGAG